MTAYRKEKDVEKQISRHSLLKRSAIALGTVAVCDAEGLAGAAQVSGSKTLASEDLEEKAMPHVIVRMTLLTAMAISLVVLASASAYGGEATTLSGSQTITITRSGSHPSGRGPAEYFTGSVRIDRLFQANDPSRASGAYVTFEPGARSAWHTHPLGQILIVTAASGRIQRWGGPIEEIRQGDVVWIPPGLKNWHGASPTTGTTHIAIQEQLDGKNVDWMEKVSDEQHGK